MDYKEFIENKANLENMYGFEPTFIPDYLFDFQKHLVRWSVNKGRSAIFADCGLGKSVMEMVWAENIIRKTNGNVLLITPLAVGKQMIREAEKFNIEDIGQSKDGEIRHQITVTNYERLHYFNPEDFEGVILDESSILKNFNGAIKHRINIFLRKVKYRLLATATAAPNDFIELGTSSEALGYLGYMDMLSKFFKNDQNNCSTNRRGRFTEATKWRLKHHAHRMFWRWVSSWSIAIRCPSDLGYDDNGFILPELQEIEHELDIMRSPLPGHLFTFPAVGLKEVRHERRATVNKRCEYVADIVNASDDYCVVWCNLNDEGNLLQELIPGSVQVSGSDKDDDKEDKLWNFTSGNVKVLITKPKIGAFGLNWQHCNHTTFFPNYSYEQWYQCIRRFWRFGQKRKVRADLVFTHGDHLSVENLKRKQQSANEMYSMLVKEMNNPLNINHFEDFKKKARFPKWV